LSLRSIRDIEAEDEPLAKVEEDGDPGDWGSEAEDEEAENSENVACESTTESAAAWLDPLPKDQAILKKGKTYNILLPHTPLLIPVI